MNRKHLAVWLAMALILTGFLGTATADTQNIGPFTFDTGDDLTVIEVDEISFFICNEDATVAYTVVAMDVSTFGLNVSYLFSVSKDSKETVLKGVGKGIVDVMELDATWGDLEETNGFAWLPMLDGDQQPVGILAENGGYFLFVYSLFGTAIEDTEGLLGRFALADAKPDEKPAQPSPTVKPATDSAKIPGYYDVDYGFGLGANTDMNLIITRSGNVRMINGTSSFTFKCRLENGMIYTDRDEISIQAGEDNQLLCTMEFGQIPFARRPNPEGAEALIGHWECCGMKGGGLVYDEALLKFAGITLSLDLYEDGTLDWHAVTDAESTVAQG